MFQTLSWKDVNYEIKRKTILKDVSGEAHNGRLCAIMGPSGSGKTTLLNILSGRNRDIGTMVGTISINQIPIQPRKFRTNMAYVMQEDALFGTQTPREAISFSATLRLPSSLTKTDKSKLVNEVIHTLGLEKCADTYIGTKFIKGISGGEKKRTSIATELVSDPGILILDEPTSGLDSYSAYIVVNTLRNLCMSGKMVISTIHQPSSEVFSLFDDVILLAKGQMIYNGARKDMLNYFDYYGYACGLNTNPADYFMFQVQNDHVADRLIGCFRNEYFSQDNLRVVTDMYEDTMGDILVSSSHSDTSTEIDQEPDQDQDKLLDNEDVFVTQMFDEPQPIQREKNRKGSKLFNFMKRNTESYQKEPLLWKDVLGDGHGDNVEDGYDNMIHETLYPSRQGASCCVEFRELVYREYKGVWRDKMALVARFGSTIFLNAIISMVFYGTASWDESINDKGPITYSYMTEWVQNHFGSLIQVGIGGMFAISQPVVLTFPQERPIFLREYALGMYSSIPYFISKLMVEIPMAFIQSCVIFLSTYFFIGFQGNFLYLASTLTLFGLCASSISMLIGAVSANVEVAFQLTPLLTVPQLLFSGFFISINKIPTFIRWVQYICALKYGINLLMISEFDKLPVGFPSNQSALYYEFMIGCPEPSSKTEFYCPDQITPDEHALFPKNNVDTKDEWIYVGILGGVFAVLRIVSCIVLSSKAYFS